MVEHTKTPWRTCAQDPWYVECDLSDYTSVGISHDEKIKAIAVGFGDEDYADEIVDALNSHASLVEENERLRKAEAERDALRGILSKIVDNKATMYTTFTERPVTTITFDDSKGAWNFTHGLSDARAALNGEETA